MDDSTKGMVEDAYHETVQETMDRGGSAMDAHKEGITAAAMLLAAMEGIEDDAAKKAVVDLGLRPE